jgi:hypothetical protein
VLHMRYGVHAATRDYLSPRYLTAQQLPTEWTSPSAAVVSLRVIFHPLPSNVLPLRLLSKGEPTSADPHGLSSACPLRAGVPRAACAGFELQTSDGVWHEAAAALAAAPEHASEITLVATLRSGSDSSTMPTLRLRASRFGFSPWPVNTVVTAGDVPLYPWGARLVAK